MIRRSTWILVGLFIIVLVVALYLQRSDRQAGAEATPTPGVSYLFDGLEGDIQRLTISAAAGDTVEVEGGPDGSWTLVEPAGQQADETRIGSVVSQVQNLQVVSELGDPPALNVIGLNPPAYRLAVTGADGQERVAFIGDVTPTESGYYAHREEGPVVVVSKAAMDSLLGLLETLPVVPSTPAATAEVEGTGAPEGTATPAETAQP